jgi:hypothetical protein
MRFQLKGILSAAVICSSVILILCPCAYSQYGHKCGDEFRIVTNNGTKLQGKLHLNDGDSLVLRYGGEFDLHRIARSDVSTAFHVKRNWDSGLLFGLVVGTGLGYWYSGVKYKEKECESDEFLGCLDLDFTSEVIERGSIILFCGITGAAIGAIVVNKYPKLTEVPIEKLPICITPSADMNSVRVNFTINF